MLAVFAGTGLAVFGFVYLFVVVVDPWGVLPLSPPLPRVPVSTNARFSMPALARSTRFDSAVFGTSSSRLLRPAVLDATLGGHFANLAMNAATAWEQAQMLQLFARSHPATRTVIVGLDTMWCAERPERSSGRPFPAWMYEGSPWAGYRQMANLYAVQEAASQLWVMLGLKRRRYGLDGYTDFLPPESQYDTARVDAAFARWAAVTTVPARQNGRYLFPALPMLHAALDLLPAATRKLLVFTPSQAGQLGAPGSDLAGLLAACKHDVAALAAGIPNTVVVDFMVPSPITLDRVNYWDPVHYRVPVADRIMADLAEAVAGRATPDSRLLAAPSPSGDTPG